MATETDRGKQETDRTATRRQSEPRSRSRVRRAARAVVSGAVGLAVYATLLRPRLLRLGATRSEATAALPGDALTPDATFEATNAITISAPAEAVWPWLVQLGQDRGGFYSYELLENLAGLDIHNADDLVPAWQELAVGDTIRLAPPDHPAVTDEAGYLRVALADPDRALVLRTDDDPPTWTWAFVLAPVDRTSCRLLVRSRIAVESPAGRAGAVALEPVSTLLTMGMLRGIRRRAEREWAD